LEIEMGGIFPGSAGVPPASSDNFARRRDGSAPRQKTAVIFTFSARGFFSNFTACIVNPSKPPPAWS
jgi:hypothetical protein